MTLVIENEILMHIRTLKKVKKDVSLHDSIGQDKEGNEISLIDILKAEEVDIVEVLHTHNEISKIEKYIYILDKREREVIISRFGLGNEKEMTQREIAKKLGISRSYVSRIEKRALMKMYHEFVKENSEQSL